MKTKTTALAAMVTVLLAAGACSPTAREANVDVTIDEFTAQNSITREVEVPDGGVLTVSLGSNPTTGFSWGETADISDPTVLQQTGTESLPPENTDLVGAPGTQVWTFEALQKGTTTIGWEYSRPWEGGEKAVWTFALTVTVK